MRLFSATTKVDKVLKQFETLHSTLDQGAHDLATEELATLTTIQALETKRTALQAKRQQAIILRDTLSQMIG